MGNSSTTPRAGDILTYPSGPVVRESAMAGPSAAVTGALPAVAKLCQLSEDEFTSRFSFREDTRPIGEGTFGKVYQGLSQETGEYIAVKVMNLDLRFGTEPQNREKIEQALIRVREEITTISLSNNKAKK